MVFADDIFSLARIPAVCRLANIVQQVHAEIYVWAVEFRQVFNYEKCLYTVIPPRERWRMHLLGLSV